MTNGTRTFLAVVAIAATVSALWLTRGPATPKKVTWSDVVAEAESGSYKLISTADLWNLYKKNRDSLLLIDTRQEWEYRTGHIKGAINFPMEPSWVKRWRQNAPLERVLGKDKDRTLVFY